MPAVLYGLRNSVIYMLTYLSYRHKSIDGLTMNCPVCSHPEVDDINDGLTMGVDFILLAKRYKITTEHLEDHWKHGMEDELTKGTKPTQEQATSTSTDIYSILRYKLRHLKRRFDGLITSTAATGESRELIQLSKAIDDTISVTLKVKKEMGIIEETRISELENMMSELVMIMPKMCETDQQLLEVVLGLESVEVP